MSKTEKKLFVGSFIAIVIILAVVFLSQQPFAASFGKELYLLGAEKINLYWSGSSNWFQASIYPRINKEVEKRGEPLKEEITTQKDNAAKTVWDKIKIYFAEQFSKFSGTKVE